MTAKLKLRRENPCLVPWLAGYLWAARLSFVKYQELSLVVECFVGFRKSRLIFAAAQSTYKQRKPTTVAN
ncbi:hypothetical protein ACYZTM_17145 [Pseudomonas sp. MDT2-39-1]|uniref:hypothetical protein n=1 Tax=Pseudomonas sp. BGI-2 TaxID=2528211 RepID=UPI0010340B4E|nr:hypothetical protein [Pseudomonas sp. BGI-2]TBN44171.1 hypothetical protein EYC95_16090 [Pseudomonas sp. BGI-2]